MGASKIYIALAALFGLGFVFWAYLQTDKDLKVNNLIRESELSIEQSRLASESFNKSIAGIRDNIEVARRQFEELTASQDARAKKAAELAEVRAGVEKAKAEVTSSLAGLRAALDAFMAGYAKRQLAAFQPSPTRSYSDVTIKEVNRTGIVFAHGGVPTRVAHKDISRATAEALHFNLIAECEAVENSIESVFAAKPAPAPSNKVAATPPPPAPSASAPSVAPNPAPPSTAGDPEKAEKREEISAQVLKATAQIDNWKRQMKIEEDEAQDKENARRLGRLTSSSAANRERARLLSEQISRLETRKSLWEQELAQLGR